MAFRPLLRPRAVVPALAAALSAGAVFAPRAVDAEEQPAQPSSALVQSRKPIYDDVPVDVTAATAPALTQPSQALTPEAAYRPTPTDRLAEQVGLARMALYRQAVRSEQGIDKALTATLRLEHSFTTTLRSLAPPKESGERIFPGALYVLVAAMAGSIVSRNRNIVLRATVPAAVGLTAAYAVLPLTMNNVGNLAWSYEEKYPVVADAHLRTKARISHFIETGKAHTGMTVGMVQDKVHDVRDSMEGWVKKGR
ncbi:uncharacterized protein M421DRAFT_420182 [Didymella exigua CBS 183.55]|uniref:MICOS complex subunit n=1 Tax=Didymella exigua CBS 183.55 TaxID=1150837 RepID=A0A6A5RPI5_9PLEO|nr:uncharacterized protein M421DRAFT_420182 [Didymella exigua CBS 183.55]KAF1928954.1 hypothetical protein M421DRAFT_420182 [Didymella exigua CBS 183.55]